MTLQSRETLGETDRPRAAARHSYTPVTWGLIAICVGVFLCERWQFPDQAPLGVLYGPLVVEGDWWRIVATIFEHGSILHLGLNMWVLHSLGIELENAIGSRRFLAVSAVSALGSSTFVLLFGFESPTVGASGMILGYGGAIFLNATSEGRRAIGTWLIQIALISFLPGLSARISWEGHLGGLVFGALAGAVLRLGPRRFDQWTVPLIIASALAAYLAPSVTGFRVR